MLSVFPKSIANSAVAVYLLSLAAVTLVFHSHSIDFVFMLLGVGEVLLFFYASASLTKRWAGMPVIPFEKKIFLWAFFIRLAWMVFSYCFFTARTGRPFEFSAGDSAGYNFEAQWLSGLDWDSVIDYLFTSRKSWSDSGYSFYLTCFYRVFGVNIFLARLVKCLLGAFLCVLMFRLASRNFGLETGRMTAVFCMLMPNLIWYCGMHLKEMEMIFLTVLSIERMDYALRSAGRNKFWAFVLSGIATLLLFGFRTALASVLLLADACALVLSSGEVLARWKKWVFGIFLALGLTASVGNQLYSEVTEMWDARRSNQETSLEWRATRSNGNKFARYAGKSIFAPLMFTLPFPTVVEIEGQENQNMLNGGNYVKNITSFFTIFALFLLLFNGEWRKHVLPIAFVCGYLIVVAFSAFAQSERFHLPALSFSLMFAAYGITHINKRGVRLFKWWKYGIFAVILVWSWFKLAGRGLA